MRDPRLVRVGTGTGAGVGRWRDLLLSQATVYDPSSIASVITPPSVSGRYNVVRLRSPAALPLPSQGVSWSMPLRSATGRAISTLTPHDLQRLLLWRQAAIPADMRVFAGVADAALGTATVGWAVALDTSTNTRVSICHLTGGSWTVTTAASTDAACRGVYGDTGALNATSSDQAIAVGVTAARALISTANTHAISTTNISYASTVAFVGATWIAGSGTPEDEAVFSGRLWAELLTGMLGGEQ